MKRSRQASARDFQLLKYCLKEEKREREREKEMPLQRLECEVQNYAWGKIGSESKVARFKQVEGTKIDEVRFYNVFFRNDVS